MRRWPTLLIIGLLLLLGCGSGLVLSPAQPGDPISWPPLPPNRTPASADQAAQWRQLAEQKLQNAGAGAQGMWIAVADPKLGYWEAAIGHAVANGTAADIDDHARIGSVTKTFTATAILEQVAKGNLTLDDSVTTVMPEISKKFPSTASVTVRQLLSMNSGVPDYVNKVDGAIALLSRDTDRVLTADDLIELATGANSVPQAPKPGYSNTNYVLLGLMLEHLTGSPISQVLTDTAKSAGLEETGLTPPTQTNLPEPASHGYLDDHGATDIVSYGGTASSGQDVTSWSPSWGNAAAGMYSTVRDLFDWASNGSGTALLPDDLAAERLKMSTEVRITTGTPPAEGSYFFGLGVQPAGGGFIGGQGNAIGWSSFEVFNPTTGATFVAIVNSTNGIESAIDVFSTIFLTQ